MAAPSRVLSVANGVALTECFGQQREVSLLLLDEEVSVGDYVLIQTGGFAFEKVEPKRAEEALALMRELTGQMDDDARVWGST